MLIHRPSDIGLLVKAARKARSMSQDELARRLGVSRLWINKLEGGKPTARLDLVLRALAELGITLAAQTESPVDGGGLAATPIAAIDIDDIADTGLSAAKAWRDTPALEPTKRGKK